MTMSCLITESVSNIDLNSLELYILECHKVSHKSCHRFFPHNQKISSDESRQKEKSAEM